MNRKKLTNLGLILAILALSLALTGYAFAEDNDGDGVDNTIDNCMNKPNGPILGTCIAGSVGITCTYNTDCGAGGVCSKNQENSDADSCGDACDYCFGQGCYDVDADGFCGEDSSGDDNCPYTPNPDQNSKVCTNTVDMFAYFDSYEGSWYEIGRQIAHAYPDNIIAFANLFGGFLVTMAPPGWTPQRYYAEVEDTIPQSIKDHMQGMAMGLTEATPLSYQAAWDMVLTENFAIELINMPQPPGCTAFAVASSAGTFLCHNTDAAKQTGNLNVVMYWKPDNGDYAYITKNTAGWADVSYGLNEKGIGITLNAGSPNVNAAAGMPINFMVRYVMEHAATLAEAVNYISDYLTGNNYGTSGAMLLLVDFKDSSMAMIQVRSEVIRVTYGEELKPGVTYLAATNHFLGDFNEDPTYQYQSSLLRYQRLLEILPQYDTYDLKTCWTILSDHGSGPANDNTISRDGAFTATVDSTFFTGRNVYYTLNRPHQYLATYPGPIVIRHCYNPNDADSDNDSVLDCCDNCPAIANTAQEDIDGDGVGNICDKCPSIYNPAGPDLGVCVKESGGVIVGMRVTCTDDSQCGSGAYCQKVQGDCNSNGIGDACECYADFNHDGKVILSDLVILKTEFGRTNCSTPPVCQADANADGKVILSDLVIMKTQFGKTGCPMP